MRKGKVNTSDLPRKYYLGVMHLKKLLLMIAMLVVCASMAFAGNTVIITSPTAGSTVTTNNVHVTAYAQSSSGVKWMQIYLDGTKVWKGGHTSSIDMYLQMSNGTHSMTVQGYDGYWKLFQTTESFTVAGNQAPIVTVSSPTDGATVASPVQVTASGSAGTTAMAVYLDSQSVYTTQSASVNTQINAAAGSHNLTINAWDAAGDVGQKTVMFSVGSSTPLTETISSPTDGATVASPFTVTASGSSNVVAMKVYLDGQEAYSTNSATVSTSLSAADGTHTLGVNAWDSVGNVVTKNETVTVQTATAPPPPPPSPVPSGPNDKFVTPTGNDSTGDGSYSAPWATIQYAASVAQPGWTIHVADGTYGPVTSNASGTASARIRFISDNQWGAKIVQNSGTDDWTNHGNYVDIVGFDMSGKTANHGVLNWASYVRVLGNRIHDLYVPIAGGCTNGGAAIDHAQYTASHNDTIGNVINNIGTATSGSCAHGIYMAMAYGSIQNNVISNTTKWGITTWHAGTNLVITNNTIFENHGSGAIQIGQGDAGLTTGTDYSNINNNIIVHNAIGIELEGTVGSHNTYDHNLMYANSTNWYNASGASASLTNSVTSAPSFVNYQANGSGNYALTSGSPGVDDGTSTGAPANDVVGGTRPAGAGFDIGAYEYNAVQNAWPWF